ncbi:hypothetical protein ACE6H2_010883 [Prunus campanulata]
MQNLCTTEPRVPKIPPRTMLSDYKLTDESEVEEALNGYPASKWLANSSDYAQYRDEYIRYHHYEDLHEAITAKATTEILELNNGLNALLFSTSLEASIVIRRLRQEIEILKNTTGTTIASSGISKDVLVDDAEHEYRRKCKHDIVRKGKTKIVVPEEHEEDEEEEEEEEESEEEDEEEDEEAQEEEEEEDEEEDGEEQKEEEEDEEENEDEAWVKEKEDKDEDEDGATAKGNPDAEQHSTNQKRKGDKIVHSRTRNRKKTM